MRARSSALNEAGESCAPGTIGPRAVGLHENRVGVALEMEGPWVMVASGSGATGKVTPSP